MPTKKMERNYLADLTLLDARLWFRYRSQILDNIKGNRSSQWEHRMHCRHCTTDLRETQDHLEECTFFRKYRNTLDLTRGDHKLIFWRRITRVLKTFFKDDIWRNSFSFGISGTVVGQLYGV